MKFKSKINFNNCILFLISVFFLNSLKLLAGNEIPSSLKEKNNSFVLNKEEIQIKKSDLLTKSEFTISVDSYSRSYFKLDSNDLKKDERIYFNQFKISNNDTAFIIMDPWDNFTEDQLNNYYSLITNQKIIPLSKLLAKRGFPILILTNKCSEKLKNTCGVDKNIPLLSNLEIIYHDQYDSRNFKKYLDKKAIKKLVYLGYASNMCLLGRELGLIPMKLEGFEVGFIPDASAAVEFGSSWETGEIHSSMTFIISQWMAKIISYDDLIYKLKVLKF